MDLVTDFIKKASKSKASVPVWCVFLLGAAIFHGQSLVTSIQADIDSIEHNIEQLGAHHKLTITKAEAELWTLKAQVALSKKIPNLILPSWNIQPPVAEMLIAPLPFIVASSLLVNPSLLEPVD